MNRNHKFKKVTSSFLAALLALSMFLQPAGKQPTWPDEPGISVCNDAPVKVDLPSQPDPPKPH